MPPIPQNCFFFKEIFKFKFKYKRYSGSRKKKQDFDQRKKHGLWCQFCVTPSGPTLI